MLRLCLLFRYCDCFVCAIGLAHSVLMMRLRAGRLVFQFPAVASRPSLEPNLSPIQRVKGTLSTRVKRLKNEADHLPACSAEAKDA
jgi:hypothetical protein